MSWSFTTLLVYDVSFLWVASKPYYIGGDISFLSVAVTLLSVVLIYIHVRRKRICLCICNQRLRRHLSITLSLAVKIDLAVMYRIWDNVKGKNTLVILVCQNLADVSLTRAGNTWLYNSKLFSNSSVALNITSCLNGSTSTIYELL